MTSDSSGYDNSTSMFSPEGRIYQIEYATNATSNSGTAIGLRGNDGIVLAVENITTSPLLETNGNNHTFTIDQHIGAVVAGFMPDARHLVDAATAEAKEYRKNYDLPAPLSYIKQNLSAYVHAYTQYDVLRPFGASIILGEYKPDETRLYCIQPSGIAYGYFGCAIGKSADAARVEMENTDFQNASIMELVKEAARIIHAVHDYETNFRLELSWIGKITKGRHEFVPPSVLEKVVDYAKEMLENNGLSDSDPEGNGKSSDSE